MKRLYFFMVASLFALHLDAQKAWIVPDPTSAAFDPAQEVTIYMDITKTDCPELAEHTDLYMWTWNPNELPADSPKANGTWTESNEIMKLTAEGNGIFSYTLIPTEFYEVSAEEVYANDFSFLAKLKNGSGGVTSCPEDKTEDLEVLAEPFILDRKVYSFPDVDTGDSLFTTPDDFFTLIYNKNLEEKENILAAENYNVFLKIIGSNGSTYTYAPPTHLDDYPELRLVESTEKENEFYWTIQPKSFTSSLLPDGVEISTLLIRIAIENATTTNDLVDGSFEFHFICH